MENERPPRVKWLEAEALHDQARQLEAEAILDALQACDGFEKRAAELLGVSRTTLTSLIGPRGRHAGLREKAAKLRAAVNYSFGRPAGPAVASDENVALRPSPSGTKRHTGTK